MIEAMVISIGEPQLERCMKSVSEQTVPFSSVIHVDGVVPNSEAFNRGIRMSTQEWVMHIAGDFILYPNAVEVAEGYIRRSRDEICGYYFKIVDTFLDCETGFCSVLRTKAFKKIVFNDTAWDDRHMMYRLRASGWRVRKPSDVIATHFDKPNEFQVFRRFFFHGSKFNDNTYVRERMKELYLKTKDPLYQTGVRAILFAKMKKINPGSPNVDLAKKMFNEFRIWDFNMDSRAA